jgi:hypothetical protein
MSIQAIVRKRLTATGSEMRAETTTFSHDLVHFLDSARFATKGIVSEYAVTR